MEYNEKTLLFVDATIRPPARSRTWELCRTYLDAFAKSHPDWSVETLTLREMGLQTVTEADADKRTALVEAGQFTAPELALAQQFARAGRIVIGAPFWDCSFPALLKIYIERVCIGNVTFSNTKHGIVGLCRAKCLTYLTTCGGMLPKLHHGEEYLRDLCCGMLGVASFEAITVPTIDIMGVDVCAVMEDACARVRELPSLHA